MIRASVPCAKFADTSLPHAGLGKRGAINGRTCKNFAHSALVVYLLHDPVLRNQYKLAADYVATYGPDRRFTNFYEFFQVFQFPRLRRLAADPEGVRTSSGVPRPEPLERLDELRQRFRCLLAAGDSGATVLRLPQAELDAWRDLYPYAHKNSVSACFFVMVGVPRDGEVTAVVNVCGMGHGKHLSRFCWVMDQIEERHGGEGFTARLRTQNQRPPTDAMLADVGGYFGGFGVESHPSLAEYSIRYPGEALERHEDEVISLADVEVAFNPETSLLELWSKAHQRRICPVHLSLLAPNHAPPLFRGLLEFSPPLSAGVALPVRWRQMERDGITYSHKPRIQVGRVVLSREEWSIPRDRFPRDADPLEFWIALRRLARCLDLPHQVFRRSDLFRTEMAKQSQNLAEKARRLVDPGAALDPAPKPGADPADRPARDWRERLAAPETGFVYKDDARNPMFLDLDSLPLVQAFSKSLPMMNNRVYFAEALPAPADAVVTADGNAYVSEFVLELPFGSAGGTAS